MKINRDVIETIKASFITLDELAHMYNIYTDSNWDLNVYPASINKLLRLNMIDSKGQLTNIGENVLMECFAEDAPPKIEATEDFFSDFWKLFPRDDGWGNFNRTRQLRWNKVETKSEYDLALKNYSHEEIMDALKREIKYRSIPSRDNMFSFMCNSVNWFKKKAFEAFIDGEDNENVEDSYGKKVD